MEILLWTLAGLLAVVFATSGTTKLVSSRERLIERTPWVEQFPHPSVRGIGALEVLGAIGLILPAALGIAPWLTAFAAAGLGITMVFAALLHLRREEDDLPAAMPAIVLGILSVFVAWMRFGPYAF
ncbi:DoxX family protein [Brachybacterium phenoliresistens]|uniref:DoxX family protein n=1 Tax=Brachybacterium phenoliresistens TaxID=396014 RepID=Z9JQY1_9MICO|nr:DoxX family protein [Brachybacterium phenoliresistens]EWS80152.1 DoxX family protein [Brachybacterium phenoliresistens]